MQDSGTHPKSFRGAAILIRLGIVVAVLGVAAGGLWLVVTAADPVAGPTTNEIPALEVEPADVEPRSTAPASNQVPHAEGGLLQKSGDNSLVGWAERIAPAVDIPARALTAYGNAELVMRHEKPECHLSWTTLAGIGRVESNHGRYGGAALGADGRPSKPIIGVPLDGSAGVKAIPDTDGGRFDGDPVYDRAVGPMQFIPSTWAQYGRDATGDGTADPHQIDDAALSAAYYLCAGQRDLATPDGWWAGVFAYNNSTEYGQKVFGLADTYASRAQTASTAR